jgi:hypothetical protein
VVRELQVCVTGQGGHAVAGGPPGDLDSVADGLPDTASTAPRRATCSSSPRRRPVVWAGYGCPVRRARPWVEMRTRGAWRHIGDVPAGYAGLEVGGALVDSVRLTWVFGSPAPSINQIVRDERLGHPVIRIHPED